MYRRSQRWMLIINNRFLSLYDYNFLLVIEKIFSVNSKICLYDFHFLLNSLLFYLQLLISFLETNNFSTGFQIQADVGMECWMIIEFCWRVFHPTSGIVKSLGKCEHRGNGKTKESSNKFSFPRLIVVPLSIHLLVEYISRQQISSLFSFTFLFILWL